MLETAYTSHVANATGNERGYIMKDVIFSIVALILGIVVLVGACVAIDNDIRTTAAAPHCNMVWHS